MTELPQSIQRKLSGADFSQDETGMSGSQVYLWEKQVLKIQEDNEEARSEYEIMRWLRGVLPVPEVLAYEREGGRSYLLMTRIAGKMACAEEYMRDPVRLTGMLADTLKALWRVDTADCPCRWGIDRKLAMAEYWVEHGMIDMENVEPDTYGEGGFASPAQLYRWLAAHKPEEEPVLVHGDFCLPNLFFQGDRLEGLIDLGRTGIGDKWQDIALCYRSLLHNYDGKYGGRKYEGFRAEMLFERLGLAPDWEKIRYYILLDELF